MRKRKRVYRKEEKRGKKKKNTFIKSIWKWKNTIGITNTNQTNDQVALKKTPWECSSFCAMSSLDVCWWQRDGGVTEQFWNCNWNNERWISQLEVYRHNHNYCCMSVYSKASCPAVISICVVFPLAPFSKITYYRNSCKWQNVKELMNFLYNNNCRRVVWSLCT